jgi:hypothetical protein
MYSEVGLEKVLKIGYAAPLFELADRNTVTNVIRLKQSSE